eukprot:8643011-Alexandrium_andersonii.AAC.1
MALGEAPHRPKVGEVRGATLGRLHRRLGDLQRSLRAPEQQSPPLDEARRNQGALATTLPAGLACNPHHAALQEHHAPRPDSESLQALARNLSRALG